MLVSNGTLALEQCHLGGSQIDPSGPRGGGIGAPSLTKAAHKPNV